MRILDETIMKKLSFPDFDVEKIEFSSKEKKLNIYVEGAWLDLNGGTQLGKGILFFSDWEKFSMKRFDPHTERWSQLNITDIEPLQDICELKFVNSSVYLYGFGKYVGHWIEWEIQKAKIHAEFIE